jgi:hypothetical protein
VANRPRLKASWSKLRRLGRTFGPRGSSKGRRLLLGSPRADSHRGGNSLGGRCRILDCRACDPASPVQVTLPNRREGADHGNSPASFPGGRLAKAWLNWLLRDPSGSIRIDADRLPEGAKGTWRIRRKRVGLNQLVQASRIAKPCN